jgi:hypothetical protein
MSQHDFNIANQGFPAFRADLNSGLEALATNSSGSTQPTTTFAYQFWYDESNDLLKMRNSDNDAWITLASFDQATDEWEVRSAVVQAVDAAGLSIKTDDGTTRFSVDDSGQVSFENYSFPTADGTSGQALVTDGSGNLSFDDVATDITSSDLPAGSVIQVVQATSTTTTDVNATSAVNVTPTVSITPSSSNNKILVMHTAGGMAVESTESIRFLLKRNGTQVWNAHRYGYQEAGTGVWTPVPFNVSYLDSPNTTSSVLYQFACQTNLASLTRHNSSDGAFSGSTTAITIAMEIAG